MKQLFCLRHLDCHILSIYIIIEYTCNKNVVLVNKKLYKSQKKEYNLDVETNDMFVTEMLSVGTRLGVLLQELYKSKDNKYNLDVKRNETILSVGTRLRVLLQEFYNRTNTIWE